MSSSPHQVTKDFEAALCAYTGSKYAATTTSCTQAILMACAFWANRNQRVPGEVLLPALEVWMPTRSYVGVPAAVRNAGFTPRFIEQEWSGEYHLNPLPVWDSARRFTSGMYRPGAMQCVSFHWGKILGLSQGGAILHDNDEADAWLRRARFDGRTEGVPANEDQVQYPSWHAYMAPETAAHGLMKLSLLPKHNPDLPKSDYPDLSLMEAFKS